MDELKEQEERITGILGADNLGVTLTSLGLYRDYLRKNLEMPCILTGIEDFPWDQKYTMDPGDVTEHEALRMEQPSRTDIYELKRFEDPMDEVSGIMVKVIRRSDDKRFILELGSLKAVDETSINYALLDDYAAWFVSH